MMAKKKALPAKESLAFSTVVRNLSKQGLETIRLLDLVEHRVKLSNGREIIIAERGSQLTFVQVDDGDFYPICTIEEGTVTLYQGNPFEYDELLDNLGGEHV
jgi:hypothetical protein